MVTRPLNPAYAYFSHLPPTPYSRMWHFSTTNFYMMQNYTCCRKPILLHLTASTNESTCDILYDSYTYTANYKWCIFVSTQKFTAQMVCTCTSPQLVLEMVKNNIIFCLSSKNLTLQMNYQTQGFLQYRVFKLLCCELVCKASRASLVQRLAEVSYNKNQAFGK